jgi:hypothetical protein
VDYKFEVHYGFLLLKTTKGGEVRTTGGRLQVRSALRISTMGDHRVVVFEATSGQVGSDGVLKWTMNLDYKRLLMRLQRFVVRLQTDF